MSIIKVSNLCKTFKVKTKEEGLRGSFKSIFYCYASRSFRSSIIMDGNCLYYLL